MGCAVSMLHGNPHFSLTFDRRLRAPGHATPKRRAQAACYGNAHRQTSADCSLGRQSGARTDSPLLVSDLDSVPSGPRSTLQPCELCTTAIWPRLGVRFCIPQTQVDSDTI